MASGTMKVFCVRCEIDPGIVMCHGCKQSLCMKHFIEHRQELLKDMNDIKAEHSFLSKYVTNEQDPHSLMARINQWENESIIKIQVVAEVARADLRKLIDKAKRNVETLVNKMTEDFQKNQESNNYSEIDIKNWTDQLEELRQIVNNSSRIKVHYENNAHTAIPLIKVSDRQPSELPEPNHQIHSDTDTSVNERFLDIFGKVTLSELGLVATCTSDVAGRFYVTGIGHYSSGIHRIHFLIEQMSKDLRLFFGIVNVSETLTKDVLKSKSSYGWRDINSNIVSGRAEKFNQLRIIQKNDEVILTLDCNNQRIKLEHYRTDTIDELSIDLQLCAFPWKIIVLLRNKNDCVRILS